MRFVAIAFALAALAPPPFVLPAPTGPHAVGTTSWTLTDAARAEPFAPGERRQLKVVAWYPAETAGGVRAPYLREGADEARVFEKLVRAAPGSWDAIADVATHALVDVPPIAGPPLPVLLFSHGYGGVASAHAALLEDLASHGYAVLSIVHPYESAATRLDADRVVTMLDDTGAPRAPYRDVIGEWGKEDETMAAVTSAADEEAQRRLLRGYLTAIPKTAAALQRWVDDTRLVLDRLPRLAGSATAAGRLARRVDAGAVGVLGHSMGGVTAADFCVADRRCRAALNLDGIPQYGTMIDRTMPAPMLMVYSARPGRLGASDAIYRRAASKYYRLDVNDTKHLDFSDLNFWGGRLREVPALGEIDPTRAAEITRTIVREYFDQELRGAASLVLSGARPLTGVVVHPAATRAGDAPESARDELPLCDSGPEPRHLLHDVKPMYTADAMKRKIEGAVFVEMTVERDGHVSRARIVTPLDPYFGLDSAVLDAAKQWRFEPAARDSQAARCRTTLESHFALGR